MDTTVMSCPCRRYLSTFTLSLKLTRTSFQPRIKCQKGWFIINPTKTNSIRINANNMDKYKVRGTEIEDVGILHISERSSVHQNGPMRIHKKGKKKAQQTFEILKPILRNKIQSPVFNSNVKSVLLNGSETWRSTVVSTQTIQD